MRDVNADMCFPLPSKEWNGINLHASIKQMILS